ncbi:MAG: FAD-dependent oxidoreductase [Kiritimatiellae bacterium]|nr:FAD-dependent oxidoreductase [Kiritimatiellia bacterium]
MTADGSTYAYDILVLATGAKPVIPPVPGIQMPGVFVLRTSEDAVDIKEPIALAAGQACDLLS